jgi:hypothetical protein
VYLLFKYYLLFNFVDGGWMSWISSAVVVSYLGGEDGWLGFGVKYVKGMFG